MLPAECTPAPSLPQRASMRAEAAAAPGMRGIGMEMDGIRATPILKVLLTSHHHPLHVTHRFKTISHRRERVESQHKSQQATFTEWQSEYLARPSDTCETVRQNQAKQSAKHHSITIYKHLYNCLMNLNTNRTIFLAL